MLPHDRDDHGRNQQRAPQQVEPRSRLKSHSRAVVIERVNKSREREECAHPSEQNPYVARTCNGSAQDKSPNYERVANEIGRPDLMRQFPGLRFRNKEKIQVGRDAEQHTLYEIQSHNCVDLARFVLGVKKDRHGQRHEPE